MICQRGVEDHIRPICLKDGIKVKGDEPEDEQSNNPQPSQANTVMGMNAANLKLVLLWVGLEQAEHAGKHLVAEDILPGGVVRLSGVSVRCG